MVPATYVIRVKPSGGVAQWWDTAGMKGLRYTAANRKVWRMTSGGEAEKTRDRQRLAFHRNQAIGLLVLAAGVLVYRLLRMPAGWALPAGWWRLW